MSSESAAEAAATAAEKQHLASLAFDSKSVTLLSMITEGKNPRGIPGAKFIVSYLYLSFAGK